MINRFETLVNGETITFEQQSALGQLQIAGQTGEQLSALAAYGLSRDEAYALAYNCTLLAQVLCGKYACENPHAVLRRFTLSEIAELARSYLEYGTSRFGGEAWQDSDEWGVNESFGEESVHV